MGVAAHAAGLRCKRCRRGAEAAGALVVIVRWMMVVKSINDGIEADCQIGHNSIF